MNQLSKHDVNKLTAQELKARLPFQIVSDGAVIAVVLPMQDVNKLKLTKQASRDHKAKQATGELKFSKSKQVRRALP